MKCINSITVHKWYLPQAQIICAASRQNPNIDHKCLFPAQNHLKKMEVRNTWEVGGNLLFWLTLDNTTNGKDRAATERRGHGRKRFWISITWGKWQGPGGSTSPRPWEHCAFVPWPCLSLIPPQSPPHPHPTHLISHLIYIHVEHWKRDSKLTASLEWHLCVSHSTSNSLGLGWILTIVLSDGSRYLHCTHE